MTIPTSNFHAGCSVFFCVARVVFHSSSLILLFLVFFFIIHSSILPLTLLLSIQSTDPLLSIHSLISISAFTAFLSINYLPPLSYTVPFPSILLIQRCSGQAPFLISLANHPEPQDTFEPRHRGQYWASLCAPSEGVYINEATSPHLARPHLYLWLGASSITFSYRLLFTSFSSSRSIAG